MTIPTIISCHTTDPLYQGCADRLQGSLQSFGLDHKIVPFHSRGSWKENCFYKANFVYAMLQAHAPLDLIWMDADSEVLQYPELLGRIQGDLATVVNNQGLFNSVIYFRNCSGVMKVVEAWILTNKAYPEADRADQDNLVRVLEQPGYRGLITFEELPWEYSYIPGVMGFIQDPVILQHQCSRKGRFLYP